MSTSKPKLPAYHHGDLRDALIAAALNILEEGGSPDALALREVARRAGVSAMAPYRHFADKEALLVAVAIVGFSRLGAALREGSVADTANLGLLGQGIAYVDFAWRNPAMFRLMFGRALAKRHGDLAAAADIAFAVMSHQVASITGPAKAEDWALKCWATVHGLAHLAIDGQLGDSTQAPHALAERILRISGDMPGC